MNYLLFNLFLLILLINCQSAKSLHANFKILTERDVLIDHILPLFRKCRGFTCGIWGQGEKSWHSEECLIEKRDRFYYLFKVLLSKRRGSYPGEGEDFQHEATQVLEDISDHTLKRCIRFYCPAEGNHDIYIDANCAVSNLDELRYKFKQFVRIYASSLN